MSRFELLESLRKEVGSLETSPTPQSSSLSFLFAKYLKEPRFQSPLTISELSDLFSCFYRDLYSSVVLSFTGSQSTKKSLIANSQLFKDHPKIFDYLLAIANYSASSIKLLKRDDNDALYQLRVFNYYKFIVILENIEREQLKLFNSVTSGDENTLYDKIFRFDQKDIIYQEFLEEKLQILKHSGLSFKHFLEISDESQPEKHKRLVDFVESLSSRDLQLINDNLHDLKEVDITPIAKLRTIVKIHKNLMQTFVDNGFKSGDLNNDIILPTIIYLLIFKLNNQSDLYLNFVFIKNFTYLLDPYKLELYNINLNSSYTPMERSTKSLANKYRIANFFDVLNLNEAQSDPEKLEPQSLPSEFEFYDNDKDLIQYILENYLNNGELNYYLTNFEAIITYLSNVTISELMRMDSNVQAVINGAASATSASSEEEEGSQFSNKFLNQSIASLVDEELETHFQLPDGKLSEEIIAREESDKQIQQQQQQQEHANSRSRSSSILNVISTKLNETRSRSNSTIMASIKSTSISLNKENFPTLSSQDHGGDAQATDMTDNTLSMMRNIIGRISSVSVPQFKNPLDSEHTDENEIKEVDEGPSDSTLISPRRRPSSFINRLSPNHTRTRSSSLEGIIANIPGNTTGNTNGHNKRNSTTSNSGSVNSSNATISNANTSLANSAMSNSTNTMNSSVTTTSSGTSNAANSITSKFTSGVSEFMTKLNSTTGYANLTSTQPTILSNGNKNVSNSSLHTLETGSSTEVTDANAPYPRRPDYVRSRTSSLQTMDKWFNNLSLNQQFPAMQQASKHRQKNSLLGTNIEVRSVEELTSFANVEFDSMSIKDLRAMKAYYDSMCSDLLAKQVEGKVMDDDTNDENSL